MGQRASIILWLKKHFQVTFQNTLPVAPFEVTSFLPICHHWALLLFIIFANVREMWHIMVPTDISLVIGDAKLFFFLLCYYSYSLVGIFPPHVFFMFILHIVMICNSSLYRYELCDVFVCLLVVNLFSPAQPIILYLYAPLICNV